MEHADPAMSRATMAMATVLAMLCLHGARGLADEWIGSNRTAAGTAPSKAPKPVVKSKVIESAAEVELANGTGDIDQEGEWERKETGTVERKERKRNERDRKRAKVSTKTSRHRKDLAPNLSWIHARIYATKMRQTKSNRTSKNGRNEWEGSLETKRGSIDRA